MSQTNLYSFIKKKRVVSGRPEHVIFPDSHIYESKPCKHRLVGKTVTYRGIKAEVLWARRHPRWGVFLRIKTGPIILRADAPQFWKKGFKGSECNGMETSVWPEEVKRPNLNNQNHHSGIQED